MDVRTRELKPVVRARIDPALTISVNSGSVHHPLQNPDRMAQSDIRKLVHVQRTAVLATGRVCDIQESSLDTSYGTNPIMYLSTSVSDV